MSFSLELFELCVCVRDRERERGAPLGVRAQVWLSECLRERVCVAVKLKGEREKKG